MTSSFAEFMEMARERHPEAFATSGPDAFSLATDAGPIEFVHAAGDPAGAIVRARQEREIETTLELVEIIRSALPAAALRE